MHYKHRVGLLGLSFALFVFLVASTPVTSAISSSSIACDAKLSAPEIASTSSFDFSIPPGMVSYWELNEGAGDQAIDRVGPNNGRLVYGSHWTTGVAGTALELVQPLYVDCEPSVSLDIRDLLTLEAWIYLYDPGGLHTIIQNGFSSTNKMYHFAVENGYLYFDRYDGTYPTRVTRSNLRVNPGGWHHVAVSMNSLAGQITFYLDGTRQPMGFSDDYNAAPQSRFTIGFGQNAATNQPTYLNGRIDEVAVYADLLSDAYIIEHYQNGLQGKGYLNNPPVASDDSYSTNEDTTLSIGAPGVLANDLDLDGDSLTANMMSGPSNGVATLNSDGSFTYNPFPDYNGVDTFTYRVFDGTDESNIASVVIMVNAINDAPIANEDGYLIYEDNLLDVPAPGVYGNDWDVDGDTLIVDWVADPSHGLLTFYPNGGFTYQPDANWYGTDFFVYRVTDGIAVSNLATVAIDVIPVNDAPLVQDDSVILDEDTSVDIDVLANDGDVENNAFWLVSTTSPTRGSLTINPDGTLNYLPAPDYNGPDFFTYTVEDEMGGISTGSVSIQVNPVNDAPVANDDEYTMDEDTTLFVSAPGVYGNDYDVDGDTLIVDWIQDPSVGLLTFYPDGSFTYVPESDFWGTVYFQYSVTDGELVSNIVNVMIIVNGVNDPPYAIDDSTYTYEDTPVVIDIIANDADPDGDPIHVESVTEPLHGTVEINPDGTVTYYPDSDYFGPDSFSYIVSDGNGGTDTGAVSITVLPVDDPSVAVDDYVTTDEDTAIIIDVMANDYDVEGDSYNIYGFGWSPPQPYGQLELVYVDGVKMIKYTPNPNWYGEAWFVYDLYKDPSQIEDRAYVYITVLSVPDAPVAEDDLYNINEDTTLQVDVSGGVLINDSDGDGDALLAFLISGPSHGLLTLNSDGSFIYIPNLNWYGVDSFVYEASDGSLTGMATVSIEVNPVDDHSVAVDDYVTTPEDTAIIIDVMANDYDVEGDSYNIYGYGWSPPQPYGQLELVYVDGVKMIRYTPNPNWNGAAWFVYDLYKDPSQIEDRAYVYITVLPVPDAPVADDDTYTINEDYVLHPTVATGVLANDLDVDGDTLLATLISGPSHGLLTLNSDGSFTYTPNLNWYGVDSFVYEVSDGSLADTATVTITVNAVDDPSNAVDDRVATDEDTPIIIDVLANDYDVEGDVFDVLGYGWSPPQPHGQLSLVLVDGVHMIRYSPSPDWHGSAWFVYDLYNSSGQWQDRAYVYVIVNPVNDAPTATDDTYCIDEDTALQIDAIAGLLANDTDIDLDALTAVLITEPSHGSLTLNADGSFTYTPDQNWFGVDYFIYQVSDGSLSDLAEVTLIVNPVNDAPIAVDDYVELYEDSSIVIDIMDNDYDIEGDTFTLVVYQYVPDLLHGQLELIEIEIGAEVYYYGQLEFIQTLIEPGVYRSAFRYTPDPNWYGTTSTLQYAISDGSGSSQLARVYITVHPLPDAPNVQDDTFSMLEDSILYVNAPEGVLKNDFDVDGDALEALLHNGPSYGLLILNADGSFTYFPEPNFWGIDSFTYCVTDGLLESKIATVTITVQSVNDIPVAVDDVYETDQNVPLITLAPGVLANDSDIDHNQLTGVLIESPSNGVIILNSDGSFEYIPNPGWYGIDSFTYQAFDGTDYSNIATVTITVILVNTPPVAFDDEYVSEACGTLVVSSLGVLENDFDNEGDSLEALLVDAPEYGILILNLDGSFTYAPNAGWCGTDSFTYQAFDGIEYSNIATVEIAVVDVTPPVTAISFSGDGGEYGWYHSDVEVTLSATDDCSGVAETVYSLDGVAWITYSEPFVLSESGEFTIHYYSTDLAGNTEETKVSVVKIGKPTRTFVTGAGWIWDADGEKGHFALVAKYHRRGNLKGHLLYAFDDEEYAYLLVDTDWIGLAINGDYALMEGKCFLLRYSYETKELDCLCDYYFRVEVWDNGKGRHDIFRILIYDESGALFHEAGFDPPGELQHGNIKIHDRGPKCKCNGWLKRHTWHQRHC